MLGDGDGTFGAVSSFATRCPATFEPVGARLEVRETRAGPRPPSMSNEETTKPTKATSPRKIEANRRNAQLSTGPKTDEGKAKSSKNSITHGIFVTKFLDGATPQTVAEIEELAAGLRDYYNPQSIVEEILLQKIVIETARYGRVLLLEQPEPG